MKVIKVGGGCLNGKETILSILDVIKEKGPGNIFVVSALYGITNILIKSMDEAIKNELAIQDIIRKLRNKHALTAGRVIMDEPGQREFTKHMNGFLSRLERLYYGLNFTREKTPRMQDAIVSYGERLSAALLCCALRSMNVQSFFRMPEQIGILTDGKYQDATADMQACSENLKQSLKVILEQEAVLFIPGFFGVSSTGDITTFGRGGTDYSASVVAQSLDAEVLEIWKDTQGFMSADPRMVPGARRIPELSYEEAAELSYFGAKILHPRTVEPVRLKNISIAIKNTLDPDAPGSLITAEEVECAGIIKSVAHSTDISVLKVNASGVGLRPGILGLVTTAVAEAGVNIKSVVTSQTCISLLLASKDADAAYEAIEAVKPRAYRSLDRVEDLALVSIVGTGLSCQKGIAAKCFTAAYENDINIEMISFGPSKSALYFLVPEADLSRAVTAIHDTFFSDDL